MFKQSVLQGILPFQKVEPENDGVQQHPLPGLDLQISYLITMGLAICSQAFPVHLVVANHSTNEAFEVLTLHSICHVRYKLTIS